MRPTEIIFKVTEAAEGGYDARALGHSIFTQGEDWNDLKAMARDAVLCHFEEDNVPRVIRLRLVWEEVIAVAVGGMGRDIWRPRADAVAGSWTQCPRISALRGAASARPTTCLARICTNDRYGASMSCRRAERRP